MSPRRLLVSLFVGALVVTSCASDGDDAGGVVGGDDTVAAGDGEGGGGSDGDEGEDATGDGAAGEGLSVEVGPARHAGVTARVDVVADRPVHVEMTATSGDHVVESPRTSSAALEHSLPLVGMRAGLTYDVEVEAFDESGSSLGVTDAGEFTTDALPSWILEHELTIDAERASPGVTLIEMDNGELLEGAVSNQHLVVYDHDGEVVWWYANTGSLGGVEQTTAGTFLMHYWPFGIREVDLFGDVVGHWRPQSSDVEEGEVDDDSLVEGVDPEQVELFVDPLRGNEGDAPPLPVRAEWVDLLSFHHENWPMPNGNVLALSTTTHDLTPEQRAAFCPGDPAPFDVISDVIVEFEPDGRVVRTWDLWDAISVDEFPGKEMCTDEGLFAELDLRDWTHANSVIYDPDRDAILISSRHTDQVIALEHLDDEGPQAELRWILGDGATMPFEGDSIHFQHAVEVDAGGRIVLFDNGNFRPGTSPDDPDNPPYSRAVVWEVDDASDDPSQWSAREVWSYRTEDDEGRPVYAPFISDADPLENGNVLVTFGGIGLEPFDETLYVLIQEVTPDGEVVWEFVTADGAEPDTAYRAERLVSLYAGPAWQLD